MQPLSSMVWMANVHYANGLELSRFFDFQNGGRGPSAVAALRQVLAGPMPCH